MFAHEIRKGDTWHGMEVECDAFPIGADAWVGLVLVDGYRTNLPADYDVSAEVVRPEPTMTITVHVPLSEARMFAYDDMHCWAEKVLYPLIRAALLDDAACREVLG